MMLKNHLEIYPVPMKDNNPNAVNPIPKKNIAIGFIPPKDILSIYGAIKGETILAIPANTIAPDAKKNPNKRNDIPKRTPNTNIKLKKPNAIVA